MKQDGLLRGIFSNIYYLEKVSLFNKIEPESKDLVCDIEVLMSL